MPTEFKKLESGVFELPDGTIAYSFDKAVEEFRKVKRNDYSVADLILLVLNSQKDYNIRGRTNLFKEIFLVEQDLFSEYLFTWENVPGSEVETDHLIRFVKSRKPDSAVDGGKVSKSPNGNSVRIGEVILEMNNDLTRVILRSSGSSIPLYVFFVRQLGSSLKVYYKISEIEDCQFVPYIYGPYSFHVANTISNLERNDLIERFGFKDTRTEEFRISEKGMRLIRQKYDNLSPKVRAGLEDLRKGLEQYGTHWILNHVYSYFPQYRAKSRVAHKYKIITWGKGKG